MAVNITTNQEEVKISPAYVSRARLILVLRSMINPSFNSFFWILNDIQDCPQRLAVHSTPSEPLNRIQGRCFSPFGLNHVVWKSAINRWDIWFECLRGKCLGSDSSVRSQHLRDVIISRKVSSSIYISRSVSSANNHKCDTCLLLRNPIPMWFAYVRPSLMLHLTVLGST